MTSEVFKTWAVFWALLGIPASGFDGHRLA